MPTPLSTRLPADALCDIGECTECAPTALGRDPALIGQSLGRAPLDPRAMVGLRRLAGLQTGADLQQLSDDLVLAQLAAQVQRGHLQLCRPAAAARGTDSPESRGVDMGAAIEPPAGGPSAPAAAPASSLRAAPPPAPPPAPAEEPAVEIDAAAQAATLRAAARDGVPFCEECEKARRAREAETA